MIPRKSKDRLIYLAKTYKLVALTGARQTGKTTLLKETFKDKPYVSLENPDNRNFAIDDPRGFFNTYSQGAILDEVQLVPHLFSYLQEIADNTKEKGLYILSGSNNFLLQESISQSLAGRVGYLFMQPFSIQEIFDLPDFPNNDLELMLKGFYPPIYDQNIPAHDWMQNYINTYLEKDIRLIKNISDIFVFERFLRLLAGRNAQEFNATALANEVGVDMKTIQSWLSVLVSSFIVFIIKPYHHNFNKTQVKRPKIYFNDTALLCALLNIKNKETLEFHPLKGAIFETLIINEFIKQAHIIGENPNLFFWREKSGKEIDLLLENQDGLQAFEFKSGQTIHSDYFKNLEYFLKLTGIEKAKVLYAGQLKQNRSNGIQVLNWRNQFI